jgi:hypothetical protein
MAWFCQETIGRTTEENEEEISHRSSNSDIDIEGLLEEEASPQKPLQTARRSVLCCCMRALAA